jgi:hypothetical protein
VVELRHADRVTLGELLKWRAATPRQVVAEKLVSVAAAWIVAIPVSIATGHLSTGIAFGAAWTVVQVAVGIPLGLRRVRSHAP